MKTILLFVAVLTVSIPLPTVLSFGACPEQPNDNGVCDTMYLELYPSADTLFTPFKQVPIYVTHDVPDPLIDSIAAFVIPLCYTNSNPTKYCSLTGYWNNVTSFTNPRSIFRHLLADGDTIHNWMMDLFEEGNHEEWNGIILNLDGISHFWLDLIPTGSEDQWFGPGSRVLLATMTFRVKDTTTVCVDSCFWPPSDRLCFSRSDAVTYIPRHNLPFCFHLSYRLGDVNVDGIVDISDVLFVMNYLYNDGVLFSPLDVGDVNCDQVVDIGDAVFLINYLFKGGPTPAC